jgi:hypothetical protein
MDALPFGCPLPSYAPVSPPSYSFHQSQTERPPAPNLPEAVLTIDLPRHQYKTVKTVMVPFDPRVSHGGKFNTLREALVFLSKHCLVHHKSFNKNLARMYLQHCRILNFLKGGYVVPTSISKREFDSEFTAVARSLGSGRSRF